jgi:1-acyl-sn-glycerol-3-phosphate acyltransferase
MALQSRLDATFRTTIAVLLLPLFLMLTSLHVLILALIGSSRAAIDRAYWRFANTGIRVGGTRLEVRGLENVRPGQAYIVVPNHESNWDPVALVAAFNKIPLRFIAKRQIIRVPIFGWALLRSGNVRVERTDTQGDVERIQKQMAEQPLDVSILFYAEGTRSRDGALHPFRKGAFVTAISYDLPVLPVGHAGTYHIWQPGLTYDDRDKLKDHTFEAVRELRTGARRRVRELGSDPGGID